MQLVLLVYTMSRLQTSPCVPVPFSSLHILGLCAFVRSPANETVAVREQLFDVVADIAEDIGGEDAQPTGPEVEQLVQAIMAVVGTVL